MRRVAVLFARADSVLAWSDYLRKDIRALMDCGGVITLPGWQESRGAALEVRIAHALGMPVLPLSMRAAAFAEVEA